MTQDNPKADHDWKPTTNTLAVWKCQNCDAVRFNPHPFPKTTCLMYRADELHKLLRLYICKPMQPQRPDSDPAVTKALADCDEQKVNQIMQMIRRYSHHQTEQAREDEAYKAYLLIANADPDKTLATTLMAQEQRLIELRERIRGQGV
jgi:hypothetical protein